MKVDNKITEKPWGREKLWALSGSYAGKILEIKKGHRLSLQHHEEKDETIIVYEGTLKLEYGQDINSLKEITLKKEDSFHIKPKTIHRMSAVTDCILFEVSTTELDDVVRHKDDYGRTP